MLLASVITSVSTELVPVVSMCVGRGAGRREGASFMILEKSAKDSSPASTFSEISTQISLLYTLGIF